MSSDAIKDALVRAHPTTFADQWKRRSRKKVAAGIEREFENSDLSLTVMTLERPSGEIEVNGVGQTAPVASAEVPVAAAPEKPKRAPKIDGGVPLRNQMVVGSQWRITADVTLSRIIDNPEQRRLIQLRDSISRSGNSQHRQGNSIVIVLGGGNPNTAAEKARLADIQKQINDTPSTMRVDWAKVEAGLTFTVTGKIAPGYKRYDQKDTDGLLVPVEVTDGSIISLSGGRLSARGSTLPLNQIAHVVEPLSIPETPIFVLRDAATGLFFGGWQEEKTHHHYGTSSRQTDVPKMVPKFSSAKKYKTSSAVKASIRDFTGYSAGLDDGPSHRGEWVASSYSTKKIDLPKTWEMVEFDKTTAVEKQVIDVQNWFVELMRLRVLTARHGSAVRGAFKKAEGVEGIDSILVFQCRERGRDFQGKPYDEAGTFEDHDNGDELLAAITESHQAMSGKTLKVKTESEVAIACSLVDAVAARLMFDHPGADLKLYDSTTLEEIVEEQEQSHA